MTITVNAPGGVTLRFPDGTSQDTIASAMRQATGATLAKADRLVASNGADAAPPPSPGAPESFLRGGADGLLMGWGDEGAAALGINPFQGNWGGQYDANLASVRAKQDAAQKANPAAYAGGQVTGAVAPMLLPGVGAVMAPVRGAGVISNATRLGVAGAGLGAAYGAGSANGDWANRVMGGVGGAEVGGALGFGTPYAGRAIGYGLNAAAAPFRNSTLPSAAVRAGALLNRATGNDGLTTGQRLGQALSGIGPDAVPVDLGPNSQRQAGALASLPGEAQTTVRDALTSRDAGANARIGNEVDSALGPAPVPSAIEAGIRTNQDALGPAYDAAFANAKAVDTGKLALNLDAQTVNARGAGQKAAQKVREMLNVVGTDHLDPNPRTLFETRNAIDGMLATEQDPKAVAFLKGTRRQVDDLLRVAVPGIKDVDAQYAELARQKDALARGQQVLDSGRTAPRPTELADEVMQGALPQGTAVGPSAVPFRLGQGARAEIDRIVGTNSNDVVALNKMIKGEGSWNRDRLATLFGQDAADKVIALVDRERRYAGTSSVMRTNSETAARTAAQKEVATDTPRVAWTATDVVPRALDWVARQQAAARQSSTNSELARMLTTPASSPNMAGVEQSMTTAAQRTQQRLRNEALANMLLTYGVRGATPQIINAQRTLTAGSHL